MRFPNFTMALIVLGLLLPLGSAGAQIVPAVVGRFDPSNPPVQRYSDREVEVETARVGETNTLVVRKAKSTNSIRRNVPGFMAQVEVLTRRGSHLIVLGRASDSVWVVALFDLKGQAFVPGQILCSSPQISTDRRYLAFVRFYPAHGGGETSDQYALLDFDEVGGPDRRAELKETDAAFLYPPTETWGTSNVQRSVDDVHGMSSGQFFFKPDNSTVLFADRSSAGLSIVEVLLPTLALRRFDVPQDMVCGSQSNGPGCYVYLSGVEWLTGANGEVNLMFRSPRRQMISLNVVEGRFISIPHDARTR